jgi:nucleoside-diphosphate-sugar epimerase
MKSPKLRIFVAGTGFTGSRILNALQHDGHEVTGMNRSGRCPDGVEVPVVAGDVLESGGLDRLSGLEPIDLMISTLSGSSLRDMEAYRSLYVDGPRRMAEALSWRGDPAVWVLGSTGVYGESGGEWVTEETPARPLHDKGQVQLDAEAAIRAAVPQACVLRLSGLYGPGRTRLVRQALRKRPFFKPEIWSNQIHGDDVAQVISQLVNRAETPPELLLVSDDQPTQRKEIFQWVRQRMCAPDGLYDEDHPHVRGANRGNKRVSNQRLRDLGIELNYPTFREGLRPLLQVD